MAKRVGRFSIAIACLSNALSAVYKTLATVQKANEKSEEDLAKECAFQDMARDLIRSGEAPKGMSEEELVEKLIKDMENPLYTGTIPSLEESKIKANEVLMASKAFVILSVSDKGVMEVYRDFTQATGPDLSALLVLSDKVAEEVSMVLYGSEEEEEEGEGGERGW